MRTWRGGIRANGVSSEGDSCLTGTKILCCRYPLPTPKEIRSTVSPNRCLDADAGTIGGNGTRVQLWDCWGGRNQDWSFDISQTGEGFPPAGIINTQGQRCLDADPATIGANGGRVYLWDCWRGPNQKWTDSDVLIWNAQGDRCLDADTGTIGRNGTRVQLWQCWRGWNQRWRQKHVTETQVRLNPAHDARTRPGCEARLVTLSALGSFLV